MYRWLRRLLKLNTSPSYLPSKKGPKVRISTGGGQSARWAPNGRELLYWGGAGRGILTSVTIERTPTFAGYPVKVIGTLAKQGNVMGQSQDNVVYIPLTVFKNHVAPTSDIGIFIKPKNGVAGVPAATDEVRSILRALRKTKFNKDDPFGLVTAELLQDLWKNISAGAFLLMILISGISLVVGAIVIANIMFVSVVERTKEIGVRRALGARKRDIRWQFLLEAALLSAVGGAIGVMIGAGIAFLVNSVFPAQVKLSFILIGIGVATVTGLLAGWIPSSQASKLPPVEALRYE